MNTIYSFIISLLLFSSSLSFTPISERKFKWQVHSFNDPREIKQILKKELILSKSIYILQLSLIASHKTKELIVILEDVSSLFMINPKRHLSMILYIHIWMN